MKQKNYQRWSRPLLLTLLSVFMAFSGANSAWADTLTEDFESVSPAGEPYYGTYPELSNGWKVIGGYISSSSGSTNYGLWNIAHEGSKSLEASYSSSNSASVVITTKLSGTFTFWARKTSTGSTAGYLKLYKANEDGGVYSVTANEIPTTVSTLTTTWTQYSADLGDEGVYVAINLIRAAIDDISGAIYEEGTLAKPTAFTNTATTYDSAEFSWTNGGTEEHWQLIFGTTADFDKAAATPVEVSTNPYTLTELDDNTTYYAFLRATDGNATPTDYSAWTSPVVSFTTPEHYPKPTDLTASSVTASSASLGWTKNGTETAWQIAYKAGADFDPTDGENGATTVAADANPYSLTGLSETTTYYAYVRAKIDGETFSRWSNVVSFTTPEAYPTPTDFAQTAFTSTTATMSWTANGGESKWKIKYSTDENFDPASAGTLVTVTTNPYTLEGLTDGTTYYAYVQADYGSGNVSAWSNKITLTPTSTLNLLVNNGSTTNEYTPIYGYYLDNTLYLKSQFVIPSSSLTSMINRQIKKLTFYSSTANSDLGNPEFDIYLKEVANTTFSQGDAFDLTGSKVYAGTLSIVDGEMVVTLTTPFNYTTGNLMITVIGTKTGSYAHHYFYGIESTSSAIKYSSSYTSTVENFLPKMTITSDELPAVITPTGLVKNSVTATTATLGWTENGDATTWQIKYSTTESFDPDSEGTLVEANAKPYTVTGLEPETTYYAYVRAKKGGDVSDWSNKVSFTTEEMYPKPTAISVSPADVSATFRWTAGRDEAAWQIKYSTDENFDPASEGTLQAVTTNPYTLSGLTVGETYYAYIRADYGESHYSAWSNKLTLTTGVDHELTVNEGNGSTTNGSVPFYGSYADEAIRGSSQFIIPASQLGSMKGGSIDKITFYTTGDITWSSGVNPTFKVYLKEVNNEKFGSKEFIDWATMTEIYDGEIVFDGNQLNISLSTPFNYSGGNLMIGFYQTVAGGWCATTWVGASADNEVGVQNASGATTYNWAAFLPKTTFNYETLTGPRLAVSTDALDFGELNQSSTAEDKQKTFTISNTGVAELTGLSVAVSGTGYSVSALPRTNITTAGAESTPIELTVTLAPTVSGSYPGTVTISAAGQPNKVINLTATYVADPILGVFNDVDATDAATTGETINFGYVEEAPVYTYYIKNTGAGTLDIAVTNGGFTVSPANASLAAGEQQAFTITPNVANADATVTFTGKNHDGGAVVGIFTVTLQGTVMPLTTTFFEGFNYADKEATTTELDGWEIENNTNNLEFKDGKLLYQSQLTESAYVITPKLRVAGTDDVMSFSAYVRYLNAAQKVVISYSADKVNWTEATTKAGNTDFDAVETLKSFQLNGIPEGSYYFKIELADAAVGYFYGFSTSHPAAVALNESSTPSLEDNVVRDVTLTRNFIAGWNTICLPFAVAASDMESKFGAGVKLYDCTGFSENVLSFQQVNAGIDAGKPYLIYVADAITDPITFWNATISATAPVNTVLSGVTFHGTFAPIAAGDLTGMYGISKNGRIAKADKETSMKGFRGYLEGELSSARISIFDETTGISRIYDANEVFGKDAKVYNLSGQKVENAKKGVYIVNGRKVVVK